MRTALWPGQCRPECDAHDAVRWCMQHAHPPHILCNCGSLAASCAGHSTCQWQSSRSPLPWQECTRDCGNLLICGTDPASADGQRLVKASRALHKVWSLCCRCR